jgi:endonuclease/exonuclease/phosphatase (EEP) superfamily protein YafD
MIKPDIFRKLPSPLKVFLFLLKDSVAIILLLTVLGFFSQLDILCDIAAQFRVQYAIVLSLALVVMFLLYWRFKGQERIVPWGITAFVAILINLVSIFSCIPIGFAGDDSAQAKSFNGLTILNVNMNYANTYFQGLEEMVRKVSPDIVTIQEYSENLEKAKPEWLKGYPYNARQARTDPFGLAIFSKYPISDKQFHDFGNLHLPTAVCTIDVHGKKLHVIDAHPTPPVNPSLYESRNLTYKDLSRYIQEHKLAEELLVVAGDFNCVPWSGSLLDFRDAARLRNSREGFSIAATWPNAELLLPIAVPIDHIFVSKQIKVRNYKVESDVGSDHFPQVAQIELP